LLEHGLNPPAEISPVNGAAPTNEMPAPADAPSALADAVKAVAQSEPTPGGIE